MTTTELIKLLQANEMGGISHRSREISLTVNGRCLPEPQITLSSTGDGILGPEIWLDVDGEWLEPEADRSDEVIDKIRAERSKFEKAITEIEVARGTQIRIGLGCTDQQEREKHLCAEHALALALEIIKRNIGERDE